ncbi:hypothetical protein NEAUS03_0442 [Nematocida ausubeli]|nr:hypothetical protein NEAUS03_0442 [Nematocida ausubeli]
MKENENRGPFIDHTDIYIKKMVELIKHCILMLNEEIGLISKLLEENPLIVGKVKNNERAEETIKKISVEIEKLEVFRTTFVPYIKDVVRQNRTEYRIVKQTEIQIKDKRSETVGTMNVLFIEIIQLVEYIGESAIEQNPSDEKMNSIIKEMCDAVVQKTFQNLESIQKFNYVEKPEIPLLNTAPRPKVKNVSAIRTIFRYYVRIGVLGVITLLGMLLGVTHMGVLRQESRAQAIPLEFILGLPVATAGCICMVMHCRNNNKAYYKDASLSACIALCAFQGLLTICTGLYIYFFLCKIMNTCLSMWSNLNMYLFMWMYSILSMAMFYNSIRLEKQMSACKNIRRRMLFMALYGAYLYSGILHIGLIVHLLVIIGTSTKDSDSLAFISKIISRFIIYVPWAS